MRVLRNVYLAQFRTYLAENFQYRVQLGISILGIMVEPVIYMIVWMNVAEAQGGAVAGYTASEFAGYFVAWTVVRQFNIGWSPWSMEHRIRTGELSPQLLRPVHPFHIDTAMLLGLKVVTSLALIPTIVLLTLLFRPEIHFVPWSLVAFLPSLILAFLLRHVLMYAMSLTAFWTTRVTAMFQIFFAVEFFLSGRIAPLTVLPEWAQRLAAALPFQWSLYFPLELVLGRLTPEQALAGLGTQAVWLVASVAMLLLIWRFGVRRYAAVGG